MSSNRFCLKVSWCLAVAFLLPAARQALSQAAPLPIMPVPAQVVQHSGRFLIDGGFQIVFKGHTEPRLERARERFLATLRHETGILRWPPSSRELPPFIITTGAASAPVQQLGEDESYHLDVSPTQIKLDAPNPLGILHGLQTLLQLVHTSPEGFIVSAVTIDDRPRFPWRGLMIDTGRHFMPLEVIRQNLNGMEAVKLNVLHWHVSEDQGERIESKIFPLLQQKGSDGMYYSQAEVKELIEYARDRGIRVYPEFEMPSHASSLFPGYPELGDAKGPYRLKRRLGDRWDRQRDPAEDSSMDPTQESTYEFLDRFLGEMSSLFPDAYFHVGGDAEDAIIEWATNPRMKQFMSEHGLKDTAALQAYFSGRVQKLVRKYGKTMVGWDEVLTPETPKDVVIQSWRGLDSLALSTGGGHPGILSWGYYLDLNEPASRHYAVDPLDGATSRLTPAQQKNILGGETAMWTEFLTLETINGRIWPMAAVIAERLWSPRNTKDLDSMYSRLAILSLHLADSGLPYQAARERWMQRMVGDEDPSSLKVLASVMEPPKGYPRGGNRQYDVYIPLNHLSDIIPAESDRAREFRNLAARIATGEAAPADGLQARQWLTLWRDNDAQLQPILPKSALTAELVPVSRNLSGVASIGLLALDDLEQHKPVPTVEQQKRVQSLKEVGAPSSELTNMIVPGVEMLVLATKP